MVYGVRSIPENVDVIGTPEYLVSFCWKNSHPFFMNQSRSSLSNQSAQNCGLSCLLTFFFLYNAIVQTNHNIDVFIQGEYLSHSITLETQKEERKEEDAKKNYEFYWIWFQFLCNHFGEDFSCVLVYVHVHIFYLIYM